MNRNHNGIHKIFKKSEYKSFFFERRKQGKTKRKQTTASDKSHPSHQHPGEAP